MNSATLKLGRRSQMLLQPCLNSPLLERLVGRHGAGARPLTDGGDFFGAGDAQGLGGGEFAQQNFGGELLFGGESSVQASDDGLLDFRAGEAFTDRSEFCEDSETGTCGAIFASALAAEPRPRQHLIRKQFLAPLTAPSCPLLGNNRLRPGKRAYRTGESSEREGNRTHVRNLGPRFDFPSLSPPVNRCTLMQPKRR